MSLTRTRYGQMARRPSSASAVAALTKVAARYAAKRRRAADQQPRQMLAEAHPLTGQFDYKTDYRKRRFSRRRRRVIKRRRRWRRKVVNTIRNANVGSTHLVKRAIALLTTTTSVSNAVTYGMYGLNGTSSDDFNPTADIREFFREISETDWTNALNGVDSQQHRIYSMHATMEMTIRNTGDNDALVEAYFIRGTRRTQGGTNPTAIYADGFAKAALASDPNTGNTFDSKLTFTTIGTTPFQSPWFCRHYKIYKRQKFRIPPGNEVNFVIHDRKPRVFGMESTRTASTDRAFHGVLFQQQGSPIATVGSESTAQATSVTYLSVRRYRVKMFRDNLPKTAYDISGS